MRSLCTRCRIRDSVVISRMPQLRTGLFGMLWFAAALVLALVSPAVCAIENPHL
jgi:hypothetical protein